MDAIPISIGNIIFAFSGAAFIFLMMKAIRAMTHVLRQGTGEMLFEPNQREDILKNCYKTFPIERMDFGGGILQRGETVRITTDKHSILEGQFVGINKAEMVCIMTDKSVIAQSIGAIIEIQCIK